MRNIKQNVGALIILNTIIAAPFIDIKAAFIRVCLMCMFGEENNVIKYG